MIFQTSEKQNYLMRSVDLNDSFYTRPEKRNSPYKNYIYCMLNVHVKKCEKSVSTPVWVD